MSEEELATEPEFVDELDFEIVDAGEALQRTQTAAKSAAGLATLDSHH